MLLHNKNVSSPVGFPVLCLMSAIPSVNKLQTKKMSLMVL